MGDLTKNYYHGIFYFLGRDGIISQYYFSPGFERRNIGPVPLCKFSIYRNTVCV